MITIAEQRVEWMREWRPDWQKLAEEDREEWRKIISEPVMTIQIEDYTYGFWQIPSGVCVIRIDKQGPNPATQQVFNYEFIDKLVSIRNWRENKILEKINRDSLSWSSEAMKNIVALTEGSNES